MSNLVLSAGTREKSKCYVLYSKLFNTDVGKVLIWLPIQAIAAILPLRVALASQLMLKTPASFTPVLAAQSHAVPANFIFSGDELLVQEADLALPSLEVLARLGLPTEPCFPVGLLAGRYCQTAWIGQVNHPARSNVSSVSDGAGSSAGGGAPGPVGASVRAELAGTGLAFRKLRSLFGSMDEALLSVAGRAFQISNWARTHRFCGACGTPTVHVTGERCVKCPACGFMAYPRISPAMMVLIKRGDSILLARHKTSPAPFFTALAGFVEAGESVEEAIHREVFEEVGLTVRNIAYFGSQPWPFPHSLMIAYTAEFEGGEIKLDEAEIAEAHWFGPGDALPKIPFGLSIASDLIRAHLPGLSPGLSPGTLTGQANSTSEA